MPFLDSQTADLLDEAAKEAGYVPHPTAVLMPTVLLIEDDPTSAILTGRYLKRVGVRTLVAGDAEKALLMFEEHTPDAVIVDVNVPRLPGGRPEQLGADLVQMIRETPGPTHPYVIVLTGTASEDVRAACLRAGADDIYLKTEAAPLLIAKFGRLAQQMRSSMQIASVVDKLTAVTLDLRRSQHDQTQELERQTGLLQGIDGRLKKFDPLLADWTEREETVRVVTRLQAFVHRWWKPIAAVVSVTLAAVAFIKTGKLP